MKKFKIMKIFRIVLILLLLLTLVISTVWSILDYTNYFSLREIKGDSLFKLNYWVHTNIEYKLDDEFDSKYDFWQTPKETLELKTGDCEDMAILLQELADRKLNLNVELMWIVNSDFTFSHMVIVYDDVVYDPTSGEFYELISVSRQMLVYKIINKQDLKRIIKYHR